MDHLPVLEGLVQPVPVTINITIEDHTIEKIEHEPVIKVEGRRNIPTGIKGYSLNNNPSSFSNIQRTHHYHNSTGMWVHMEHLSHVETMEKYACRTNLYENVDHSNKIIPSNQMT